MEVQNTYTCTFIYVEHYTNGLNVVLAEVKCFAVFDLHLNIM